MCDRPPGLSAAEVRGAGRRIKFPRPMNDYACRRRLLPRNLADSQVYIETTRNLCLARKYTSVQWQKSEVSVARDAPAMDRLSLV
jgi:hypothetical protein